MVFLFFVHFFFKLKRSVRTTSNTSNTKTTMYFLSHELSIGNTCPNFYEVYRVRLTKKVAGMDGAGALPSHLVDYDDYIMYYKKKKCHLVLVLCFCLYWYLLPLPLNFQRVVTLVAAKIDGERARALVMAKHNLRRRYVITALTRSNDSFRPRRGVAYELAETVH